MPETSLDAEIARIAVAAMRDHVFPGAVIGYVADGKRRVAPFGRHTYDDGARAVTPETLYDTASITKAIPTSTLVLMLVDQGKLKLDDLAVDYLPQLNRANWGEVTLRHLLTYTAAPKLETNLSVYSLEAPEKLLDMLYRTKLMTPAGSAYVYNNVVSIFLGLIVEKIYGEPLDRIAQGQLFDPLGMVHTTFHPTPSFDVAPSEMNDRGLVQYEVHDESALALTSQGLISGNAGVFSTVDDLLTFAEMLLNNGAYKGRTFLSARMLEAISTNQLVGINASSGLGWWMWAPDYFGTKIGPRTFAMTGYTGAVIQIDLVQKRAYAMLCNRVYPKRVYDRDAINGVRRALSGLILPSKG